MKHEQPRKDDRDNRRAFRWGVGAAVLIIALGLAAYFVLAERRESSDTMRPAPVPQRSTPSKPPGQ